MRNIIQDHSSWVNPTQDTIDNTEKFLSNEEFLEELRRFMDEEKTPPHQWQKEGF